MGRFICIHGHFYQPPRENPWLEAVELQDSAYPYHDWNEKITAECYALNAASRILDGDGYIQQLVNNYSKMSFNFGPTLLAWMEKSAPDVYSAVLEADELSRKLFSGHGSAMAQAYNHMILPLATRHDKETQVIWGIRDFQRRFGRDPEGMWLPETAVDLETLDIMAEQGIKFTLLAPRQAHRIRPLDGGTWRDVRHAKIDPTRPYRCSLPSGRDITLFFYDGPISQALAFEGLLDSGEALSHRLLGAFAHDRSHAQLVHIATDGESYGHHHRHGDMALAYAIHYIESNNLAQITNYGCFLEHNPPMHEVEIFENTSWSCVHGIERWHADCGCNSGGYPNWNQGWRQPLRDAFDWMRDTLEPAYETAASVYLADPWKARNDYIDVILDRSSENVDEFLSRHAVKEPDPSERITILRLLELQRHLMLMYTSCGWFFDELSGIETVQVIQYAGRALQLAKQLFGEAVVHRFKQLLAQAQSNIPEHSDGRAIYEKWVSPAMLDLIRVGGHFAVSSLFEDDTEKCLAGPYRAFIEDYRLTRAGRASLAVGKARFVSSITEKDSTLSFSVLHLGDHNINCGVRECQGDVAYAQLVDEFSRAFEMADFAAIIRLMDRHFGTSSYSLTSLFRDEQRKVLDTILQLPVTEAKAAYSQIYDHYATLMRFLKSSGLPVPPSLDKAAEFVLDARIYESFRSGSLDPQVVNPLLEEAKLAAVPLDTPTLEYAARKGFEGLAQDLLEFPQDMESLERLNTAAELIQSLPFEINLRRIQNICYDILQRVYPAMRRQAEAGDDESGQWVRVFRDLAGKLLIKVSENSLE
jgi:alpha-amylase/alpha-mannosidase (GH57 family)